MLIEFYKTGDDVPPLYDLFIAKDGAMKTMRPEYPRDGLLQVVLDRDYITPNVYQLITMKMIIEAQEECECAFFDLVMS